MTTLAQSNLAAGTYTPSQRYAGDAQIVSVNATLAAGQNLPDLSVLGRITATGLLTLCNTGAADGSQTPVAILVEATNAVANSAVAVYTAGEFNIDQLNWHSSFNTDALRLNAFGVNGSIIMRKPGYSG
jgi:hypothetical protein